MPSPLDGCSVFNIELGLLRKFKRQWHIIKNYQPNQYDYMEWFALMQHYGAPTRLLDWTYSFFVATFFAIENVEDTCAIWAFDNERKWIYDSNAFLFKKNEMKDIGKKIYDDENIQNCDTFEKMFMPSEDDDEKSKMVKTVYPINPYKVNERLVIQQGIFLCPSDISSPFVSNLANLLETTRSTEKRKFMKYIISAKYRREILQGLRRMNMNRSTLFPGIDGFSASLKTLLASPEIVAPFFINKYRLSKLKKNGI